MNSLEDVTLRRLRTVSSRLIEVRNRGIEIDPVFEAASVKVRMQMLLDAVGVMPSATYVLAQVDRSQPWGPRNVCWRTHVNNAKTLHAGDWSPTAQCAVCKSFRTKIIGTDTVRGIRWHRCKCGRQFETEMLDVEEYEHRTTAAKVLTYDGITQTIREWASERNMTPDAIRGRIANGWSVEEALNTRTQRHLPRPEKLTFKGITQSIEQWASDLGITSRTIHERILRGMSVQDVLSTSGRLPSHRTVNQTLRKHRANRSTLSCNGRTQSVAEWSRETGISDALIRRRIKLGWSVKRTLETPVSPRRMVTHDGRTLSVADWSRETGLTLKLIVDRLRRGWSMREVVDTPSGVPRIKRKSDSD